jgi:hypothetical protein
MKPLLRIAVVALMACSCGNGTITGPRDNTPQGPGDAGPLLYLDLNSPTISQPITPADLQAGVTPRFVQVDVAEVINPNRRAVFFEVHYQPSGGERIHLGGFSLYPSDNPGRFIVATQGKVRAEGTITLTMTTPDTKDPQEQLRAGVRRMRFVQG